MSNQTPSVDERPRQGIWGGEAAAVARQKSKYARDPRRALARLVPYLTSFKAGLILVMVFVLIYTSLVWWALT